MPANAFLVDRALGAVPLSRLLDVRMQLRAEGSIDKLTQVPGDRPILTGDQTLQPNTIYPAEKSNGLGYYLPQYRVQTDPSGHPAVELRIQSGSQGEIGRLTITLTWSAPQSTAVNVRPMDVVVNPTLRYRVPVQASGGVSTGGWERTTALQPFVAAGAFAVQSVTSFSDKGLFDAVYQALSKPEQNATLDLSIRARVGVRTWRQVVVGQPTVSDQTKILIKRGALFTDMVRPDAQMQIRAVPMTSAATIRLAAPVAAPAPAGAPAGGPTAAPASAVKPMIMTGPMIASPMIARRTVAGTAAPVALTRAATFNPVATDLHMSMPAATGAAAGRPATPAPAKGIFTADNLRIAYTPALKDAVAKSDLKIAGRPAVPVNVVLDPIRQPAVVDADLDNSQSIPFSFNPAQEANRGVFIQGYQTELHLLVPLTLVAPDGKTHTVYQDSLMRDVIHMPPSGFRLERDATSPFLPALSFLASDFSTTDNDNDADVLFRVMAAYRLEPWLDPDVVELARTELAKKGLIAQFTTGTAHDAKLSLDLDLLGDAKVRTGATVDPAVGITDTLDLDHQTFVRLWREHLAGGGVAGWVEYQLFDGSPARIPVELSLRESSAELFEVNFIGPVPDRPGRYRVTVRNRVESAVRITKLPAELIAGGGVAHAADSQTILNQVLQPQETRQLDYDSTGTTGDVTDFSPTVIGQAEPNLSALLRLLMVAKGYSSLGFTVSVKAAAGAFGPPAAGAEPLTGLLVEFDDGTRTTLTASSDRADVTVVGRMIDQILGTADDSQRYFYRVTNLHASGEGARTSWTEGHGTGALEVSSAIVRLDF